MKNSVEQILTSSRIGFEFEFLSKENPINIARELSDLLGTRVVVPMNADTFGEEKLKYHTPIKVTPNLFKLESDFSGGLDMKELVTGPLNFKDAKVVLIKVLNWIDKNAWTTDRAACQLNISFDEWKLDMKTKICDMNPLKFCLNFNENYTLKRFPNRKGSIYAKSIKHIVSNNIFNVSPAGGITQFTVAPDKYYAVNLTKMPQNYIEFRSIGGKDYQKKKKDIIDIMEFSIIQLFNLSQQTELNENDINKLKKIFRDNKKYLDGYKSPELFAMHFPKIQISANLMYDPESIKTMWHHFRDALMEIVMSGNITKGQINYDSEVGRLQVKEADLKFCIASKTEFILCTGYGVFSDCVFYDCTIENSKLMKSELQIDNKVKDSKVEDTIIRKNNTLTNCFINETTGEPLNGTIEGGIIRKGIKGANLDISKETQIVELEDEKPKLFKGTYGVYKNPEEADFQQAKILYATPKK